jgi:F0F1-type ATP synthase membrane subunit a
VGQRQRPRLLGAMFLFFFYRVGQRMTTDTPSGTQNFIESIIDFGNVFDVDKLINNLKITSFKQI